MVGVIMGGEKSAGKEIFCMFVQPIQPGFLSLTDPYVDPGFQ